MHWGCCVNRNDGGTPTKKRLAVHQSKDVHSYLCGYLIEVAHKVGDNNDSELTI